MKRKSESEHINCKLIYIVNICNKIVNICNFIGHELVFFFAVALRPNAGHGLLILEVSR